jgi:hypothetical protein
MCSFTANMNYHITLQTKGTSICFAIKESYNDIEKTIKHISKEKESEE